MLTLKTGVYAAQIDRHCVTWDAGQQVIMDTDPSEPHPLPINAVTLERLSIDRISKAYEILDPVASTEQKRDRKRKREGGSGLN